MASRRAPRSRVSVNRQVLRQLLPTPVLRSGLFSHSDPKKRAGFGKWSTEVRKSAKLRLSFSAPAGHNSRAKGSNSQAALSIVKNGPPWVNCVTLTQLTHGGPGDPKERTLDLIITEELRALTRIVE